MAGYRKHAGVAALCSLAGILLSNGNTRLIELLSINSLACIVAGTLGGLFPDIDIKSKGQQLLYAILIPLLITVVLAGQIFFTILLGALAVIPPLLPHRGITHNPLFTIIAPLGGPFLVSVYMPEYGPFALMLYFFFVIGALSHLILDYGIGELVSRTVQSFQKTTRAKNRKR